MSSSCINSDCCPLCLSFFCCASVLRSFRRFATFPFVCRLDCVSSRSSCSLSKAQLLTIWCPPWAEMRAFSQRSPPSLLRRPGIDGMNDLGETCRLFTDLNKEITFGPRRFIIVPSTFLSKSKRQTPDHVEFRPRSVRDVFIVQYLQE